MPELFYDRGNHYEFVSLSQELAAAGEMRQAQTFDFTFKNVEKQYESYSGINVKLRWVGAVWTARLEREIPLIPDTTSASASADGWAR